jgi:hypothetical protein
MAFNKKDLDEIRKSLEANGKLQEKISSSASEYAKHLKEIAEIQANIQHISKQQAILKEDEIKNTNELRNLLKDRKKGTDAEILTRKKEITLLLKRRTLLRETISYADDALKIAKETNDEYVEAAKNVNKINMGLKASGAALSKMGGLIQKGFGKLRGSGIFEMDKAIRMAGVEMGIVSSTGKGLGQTLQNAAEQTQMMGVGVKDLAKMQAAYSTELGRSVQLSEKGLGAMAEIANGTMLGVDGAASLVAEMDKFNISATGSRDLIEETVNMSSKMGISSTKVLKTLQNNLKMANKYHFKGGVKGMAKMAATAAKFNISMDASAGMADELFNIEGAVEMSAKLNTMGGEWAKLGDPMKLMYQARNDMEGLQDSVINATAGMADFNSETGEFSFSGLELHRMKELEKITGISAQDMAEMAKQKAKFAKIDAQIGGGVDDDIREFMQNAAVFEDGEYKIKVEGEENLIPIDELGAQQEESLRKQSIHLKKRAEESQSFDDTLKSTIEEAKMLLLPILEGLNTALPDIRNMVKEIMGGDMAKGIQEAARNIGSIVGKAISFLSGFPKTIVSGIATAFAGAGILKAAMWIMNGRALGMGFNQVASAGGGGMPGGGGGGRKMGFGGKMMKGMGNMMGGKNTMAGRGMRNMAARSAGWGGMSSMAKMGAGLGLGLAGSGLDYARDNWMSDPDSAMGKTMGVGSSALKGAGIGMMLGPVGAAVGGLIGGIYGAVQEFNKPAPGIDQTGAIEDGILADGKITSIDSKDKVFEISKPGGAYDKAANSGPSASGGNSGGSSKIHITFGDITVKSDDGVGKIDLDKDSAFIRELATKIKESLSMSANGGVLNPNPS